jgi:hypothetical protein
MKTREMRVANIAFLLDRLAADTPPNQQIRELTQNALEAIQRRWKTPDQADGVIRWDIDWDYLKRTNQYKLSVVDNGDGMSPDQMQNYLNSLAVEGANQSQGISKNFGVGAKITALHRNSFGLIYQSWRDGRGAMVKLHRDDKEGVYGLASFELPDGPDWTPSLKNTTKPGCIDKSGTKVTLLGEAEGANTCFASSDGGPMNWLITYLNNRYFRIPERIKVQVRVLKKDAGSWPSEEPASSEKTYNFQTVHGTKALLDDYADKSGTVSLSTADVHWWMFNDAGQKSKDMSTRGLRTCKVGLVFQDEVYVQVTPPAARRLLAGFGILFGADQVVLYIEPKALDVRADTARSRIIINGEDAQEANWFEKWGEEFREKMPPEIKAMIDEIMARTDRDPDGKARERILERLKRIRDLLRPTRYRRDPNGNVRATGASPGGGSSESSDLGSSTRSGGGGRGGRSSDDYLADLVESGGERATEVLVNPKEPVIKWVSKADGTREEGELEDLAAMIAGDPLTAEIVKANADFRGYKDLLSHFTRDFNPTGDKAIERKIVEHVQEWLEIQLVEGIMTVRNLVNGKTWTKDEVEKALAPQALTTIMMMRFHVVKEVNRALGSVVVRPSKAA